MDNYLDSNTRSLKSYKAHLYSEVLSPLTARFILSSTVLPGKNTIVLITIAALFWFHNVFRESTFLCSRKRLKTIKEKEKKNKLKPREWSRYFA